MESPPTFIQIFFPKTPRETDDGYLAKKGVVSLCDAYLEGASVLRTHICDLASS